jgi:mannose-1-phosphate guanylyltransferase/mannose-6-phosphate isomerase
LSDVQPGPAAIPGRVHAVVLAGGPGERFWPASTPAAPKPFVRLFGDRSLLQQTLQRALALAAPGDVWLVGSSHHAERLRAEAGEQVPAGNLLLEPVRRDTAAAVALATAAVAARDPHAILVVMPSDHYVPDAAPFLATVRRAVAAAAAGHLVCLGVAPQRPATRYGYIVAADDVVAPGVQRALRFVEKPPETEARRLLAAGAAYWNAGLLIARVDTLRDALLAHAPEVWSGVAALPEAADPAAAYAALPAVSLDYAVLQRAANVAVAPTAARWHDVGGWSELPLVDPDPEGNFVRGPAQLLDTRDCVIYNAGAQPLVVRGMAGVLVAQVASHVTLVAPLEADTRALLRALADRGGVPQPLPARPLWDALRAALPRDAERGRPWGAELPWAETPGRSATLLRVDAGREPAWRCPPGWGETVWVVVGRASTPAGEALGPGSVLQPATGQGVTLRAEAETLLWRLRWLHPGDR